MKLIFRTPPVSVNDLYRGRRFLTKEGKSIKESLAWEAKAAWKHGLLVDDDLAINVTFYVKNSRGDLDNLLKGFLDSLTGIVWRDDKQISEIHCFREIDKDDPRIELFIIK